MGADEAQARAATVLADLSAVGGASAALPAQEAASAGEEVDVHETVGSAMGAALASFCFFAGGAIVPVVPYLIGLEGWAAVALASGLVGIALLGTGATVGVLSGSSPAKRALRQLAIGFGAAAATYLLGLAFGTSAA
jgi:VIT1/CCC1 family predicted Fe2+/Mn2+ transporter